MPWKDVLTFAVHIRDCPTVVRLLNEGQCPDGLPNGYQPLLHTAVENNDLGMTKLLLAHGADVNKTDNMHQTALFQSVSLDVDVEISEVLIRAGGLINVKDMYERTPLHYLSFFPQEVKLALFLLTPSNELLDAVDYFGNTALHLCTKPDQRCKSGCLSVMEQLLTAGADPNIQDNKGRSVLHHMSTQYMPETKLLLSKAKRINYLVSDKEGNNFMHNLIANPALQPSYLIDILESPFIPKPFWKVLLNGTNMYELSPFAMYFETAFCNESTVCKMIELGADVDIPDGLGVTPLMKSATFSLDVTKTLIQYGADPNLQDITGKNAIHLAMNSAIVSLLIEAGCNINMCDKWGCSPLQQSIFSAQDLFADVDVQTTLLMQGSDINHQDMYGATALHHAVYDDSELTTSLLKMGADRRITDKSGRTPTDVARLLGLTEMEHFLQPNQTISPNDDKSLRYPDDIMGDNLQKYLHSFELVKKVEKACDDLLRFREEDTLNDVHAANQNIKKGVTALMEDIAQRIGEHDEKFSIQMYTSGSSSEGTKVGLFNEFDFVFCLPFFTDICEIVEDRSAAFSGLARLKCKDLLPSKEVGHFFDDEGFLLSSELRKECGSLIKRVLRNKDIWKRDNIMMGGLDISFERNDTEKPVINFSISWIDMVHRKLDISIDVAFGIHKAGWWPKGVDTETSRLMTDAVKTTGCLLLLQVPEHRRWEGQHFRISCSLSESHAMVKLPQYVKDSYKLAKIMKDVLCPGIDFGDDEDGSPSISLSAADVISSYILKNCLFNVVAEGYFDSIPETNESIQTRRYVINSTTEIYKRLLMASKAQALPCHFLPKVDLFRYKTVNLEGFEEDTDDFLMDLNRTTNIMLTYCKVILGCLGIFDI
ncbi:uncharacterized protein LOC117325226 [Pecten maximus]|uniref:uncharacterized protein LOC117325226 n=1 Tax=Pecten maximus TaxID=6579 RepID=UPI0014589281|nr:uncharacterized protein LOC117325226 [Pecten maximus]